MKKGTAVANVAPVGNLRFISLLLAIAVLAGACSSSAVEENAPGDSGLDALSAGSDVVNESDTFAETPRVAGAPLNPFDLRAGQCYNEDSWFDEELERRVSLTASIDCVQPHDREVFFEAEFPAPNGAPFPGDEQMSEWSTEVCYEAFEGFVGLEYELSQYEISFIHPTQATFEHEVGRHRRVTCVLFDIGGEDLTGSARGTAF